MGTVHGTELILTELMLGDGGDPLFSPGQAWLSENSPGPVPSAGSAAQADGVWAADQQAFLGDPRKKILALYDEFRPRLFRYMRSMRLGRDQADEVVQETFMRLTAEMLKEARIENVQGWIVRVAHNLAIDLLKKEQGPVFASESAAFLIENRADPSLSPEDAYSEKERTRRMASALSSLNPQHRQCFQMRAQGLRYREIGRALGISEQRAAFVVKQAAVRLAEMCG
jgi:RNA polymerase sigma-70 factor (ECF subfamily)